MQIHIKNQKTMPTYFTVFITVAVIIIAALAAALTVVARQNTALRAEIRRLHDITPTPAPTAPIAPAEQPAPVHHNKETGDLALFLDMDRHIDEGELFKKIGFGREDICRLTGLSKEHVGQLIKQFCKDGNLQTYINRKRIAYAEKLMKDNSNYSMEAIAIECGIGNLSTFYRLFKQTYGVAPAEYRQQLS